MNYDTSCKLCGKEKEALVHFLIKCEKLEVERNYQVIDESIDNPEERMRKLVYRNSKYQEVGKQIKKLWDLRKKSLEEINKETPKDRNSTDKNINPLLGGLVSRTSTNPLLGGLVSRTSTNPLLGSLVSRTGIDPPRDGWDTTPGRTHPRVVRVQNIRRSTV